MSAIIFFGRHTIRPGMVETARTAVRELSEYISTHDPRHLLLQFYVDEDAGELIVVQVHPDEQSLIHHMQLGMESGHFATAYEFLATSQVDIFGELSPAVTGQMDHVGEGADAEIATRVHPEPTAGFERLTRLTGASFV